MYCLVTRTCVITLAPPDLPLPFEVIAIFILKQSLPIGIPSKGSFILHAA